VVFRVTGTAGSNRVWVFVYGAATTDNILVGQATAFNITILDGQAYTSNILLNTDTSKTGSVTPNSDRIWGDGDASKTGDSGDIIDTAEQVPHVENTLCLDVTKYAGDLVFLSFASLNDKFTFTGDSQIAHVAAANSLSLNYCGGKTNLPTTGNIKIGDQNACAFDYETPSGYCNDFKGNRLYLTGTSTFGDPGDSYDMEIDSDTPGVYFHAQPVIKGFKPDETKDCSATGNGVSATFDMYNETGTKNPAVPDDSCSVNAASRIRKVMTSGGAISSIDQYDALWIDLPEMDYDTTIIGAGTQAEITITFSKYPCGVVFTKSVVIGTFVTDCGVSDTTNLLYPFLPPLDGSLPGWWGGFTVVNASTKAGTAILTFYERDGDTATLTTPSIAAGGMWVADMASVLSDAAPSSSNAGKFGDDDVSIQVLCNFGKGAGFAFTGNGTEGTGYTAYVLGEDNAGVDRWQ
jgi:hypothetical protein